jgi:transcriptional regulator of heat shock response
MLQQQQQRRRLGLPAAAVVKQMVLDFSTSPSMPYGRVMRQLQQLQVAGTHPSLVSAATGSLHKQHQQEQHLQEQAPCQQQQQQVVRPLESVTQRLQSKVLSLWSRTAAAVCWWIKPLTFQLQQQQPQQQQLVMVLMVAHTQVQVCMLLLRATGAPCVSSPGSSRRHSRSSNSRWQQQQQWQQRRLPWQQSLLT